MKKTRTIRRVVTCILLCPLLFPTRLCFSQILVFFDPPTLNVAETFGDGGTPETGNALYFNGFSFKAGGIELDAGEGGMGDHALKYTAADSARNNGFHFLHTQFRAVDRAPHAPRFQGDYLKAGVTGIQFNARHSGIGDSVVLRATAFDGFGDGVDYAISAGSLTIENTNTSWQTYTMSLLPDDLVSGGANGRTVTEILTVVNQIGLRHDPDGTGPFTQSPVAIPTTVFFDDVMLVPEPASAVLILIGFAAIFLLFRCPR